MNVQKFYSLNQFLRDRHGEKVIKLSIDGHFTCPNRDGTSSYGGCIFCSSRGSGDFTFGNKLSITNQLTSQMHLLSTKWPHISKYIAYFQAYSNTYAPLNILKEKYEEALACPHIVGLAIGTRPDCLPPPLLNYLAQLNTRTHLWVELGLQSIHEHTSLWMNRGHSLDCFTQSVYALHAKNIEVVAHMILGLPHESFDEMLETARFLATLPLQGVKIHMLHVVDNAPLGELYQKEPFPLLTEKEYIYLVGEILQILPAHFVIHRLTGDGDKSHFIAPTWTLNKRHVLNSMHAYFKENDIYQGKYTKTY